MCHRLDRITQSAPLLHVALLQVQELANISAEQLIDKLHQYTDKALIDSYFKSLGLKEEDIKKAAK